MIHHPKFWKLLSELFEKLPKKLRIILITLGLVLAFVLLMHHRR